MRIVTTPPGSTNSSSRWFRPSAPHEGIIQGGMEPGSMQHQECRMIKFLVDHMIVLLLGQKEGSKWRFGGNSALEKHGSDEAM